MNVLKECQALNQNNSLRRPLWQKILGVIKCKTFVDLQDISGGKKGIRKMKKKCFVFFYMCKPCKHAETMLLQNCTQLFTSNLSNSFLTSACTSFRWAECSFQRLLHTSCNHTGRNTGELVNYYLTPTHGKNCFHGSLWTIDLTSPNY